MNNQDRFVEWYMRQINPHTQQPYKESGARVYLTYIRSLVRNHLVPSQIFDCNAADFIRLTNMARERDPIRFESLNNHDNLKRGIYWYARFLRECGA